MVHAPKAQHAYDCGTMSCSAMRGGPFCRPRGKQTPRFVLRYDIKLARVNIERKKEEEKNFPVPLRSPVAGKPCPVLAGVGLKSPRNALTNQPIAVCHLAT